MIDYIIIYEHPQRDLENALLLSNYLKLKGHSCDIIQYPFEHRMQLKMKYRNRVKCIVTHSLYDESVLFHLVYDIFGKVNVIVNSQCEQIVTNGSEESLDDYNKPKGITRNAFHVSWGNRETEILKTAGVKENHIIQTGPIQMDTLRKEFSGYYIDKKILLSKYNIDVNKRIMLFVSSFSYANLSNAALKDLSKKIGEERTLEFAELSKKTQNEVLEWFANYLKDNNDTVIIYRKHPAEQIPAKYIDLQNKFSNLLFISDYSVKQWIGCVDVVMTWYSTSIAEAYFSQKNVMVLRPYAIPFERDVPLFSKLSFIETYTQFIKEASTNQGISTNEEIIKNYYDVTDICSFVRLGDFLDNIIQTEYKFEWPNYLTKHFNITSFCSDIRFVLEFFYVKIMTFLGKTKIHYSDSLGKRIQGVNLSQQQKQKKYNDVELIMKNKDKLMQLIKSVANT